jgi:hypothetical protein
MATSRLPKASEGYTTLDVIIEIAGRSNASWEEGPVPERDESRSADQTTEKSCQTRRSIPNEVCNPYGLRK